MNNSGQGSVVLQDSAAVPLQNLKIFGWSTQDGTPSPENPVPIVSAGDGGNIELLTTTSNLLKPPPKNYNRFGCTVEIVNGVEIISGTALATGDLKLFQQNLIPGKYYFHASGNVDTRFWINNILKARNNTINFEFEIKLGDSIQWSIYVENGESYSNEQIKHWLTLYPNTNFEPYKSQSPLTISTPNGLPGIPVESGGNFTDINGQQWVCDEIDYERGVYVQRIGREVITSDRISNFYESSQFGNYVNTSVQLKYISNVCTIISNRFLGIAFENRVQNTDKYRVYVDGYNASVVNLRFPVGTISDLTEAKSFIANNPTTCIGAINIPVETPLSEDEIAAFQGLTAYSPTTTVSNDANCWMWIQYLQESEMSPWFYPKTEIGLYYKAYAGYSSDYPEATCRETRLIRKLLDSNYQLDFTVTDRSSRTEKYLWDLINGTNTMLANIPKSDTEKFLHMLLGGEVTEYPVIDCERNYWMSKCVEQ